VPSAKARILAASPLPLVIGSRVGPYDIRALLVAGGMGEVYEAYATRLQHRVAIKVKCASAAEASVGGHEAELIRRPADDLTARAADQLHERVVGFDQRTVAAAIDGDRDGADGERREDGRFALPATCWRESASSKRCPARFMSSTDSPAAIRVTASGSVSRIVRSLAWRADALWCRSSSCCNRP
jgi:hypothetical protein